MSQPLMWLVLGIPAATVVAGFVTLWIAIKGSDVPVPSYYAKQGLSVAPDTSREDRARQLGLQGTLDTRIDDGLLRIRLKLQARTPGGQVASVAGPATDSPSNEGHTPSSATADASAAAPQAADGSLPRRLRLLHPSNPQDDMSIHLRADGDGQWQAQQPVTWADGTRWTIVIEGDDWRLPLPELLAIEALQQHPVDSDRIGTPAAAPAQGSRR